MTISSSVDVKLAATPMTLGPAFSVALANGELSGAVVLTAGSAKDIPSNPTVTSMAARTFKIHFLF